MIQKICKACVLTAFFATAPAYALQSDSKQPIQIEADQGSLDQNNQSTTFTGNVIIKQGTLNIRAGSVNVSRKRQRRTVYEKPAARPSASARRSTNNKGTVNGQANKRTYSSAIKPRYPEPGNAKVQRGGDVAEGAVITYNTKTEVYTINGSSKSGAKSAAKSGRVSVVIQPSSTQKTK